MLMPHSLSVVDDAPDSVAEYVLFVPYKSTLTNLNHSVVFIQDSSGFGYNDLPNQSPPSCPVLFSSSPMLLNARTMIVGYESRLSSSKYIRAAKGMCLELHEARKNVRYIILHIPVTLIIK